jgi:spore maturation protein SpmB
LEALEVAGGWNRLSAVVSLPLMLLRFVAILLVMFKLKALEALNEFIDMNSKIFEVQGVDAEARTVALKGWIDGRLAKYEMDPSVTLLDPNRGFPSCKL